MVYDKMHQLQQTNLGRSYFRKKSSFLEIIKEENECLHEFYSLIIKRKRDFLKKITEVQIWG